MRTLSRKIITVNLPSFGDIDPVTVEMYGYITAGDYEEIENVEGLKGLRLTRRLLAKLIQSWNVTEDGGNPLPITAENLMQIPLSDLHYLETIVSGKSDLDDAKKNS